MKHRKGTDIRDFLVSEYLLKQGSFDDKELEKTLCFLRKERVDKPMIYVGTGTCGVVAGALKTIGAITEYINDHGLDVDLVEGGCIGFCSAEPVVDVQLPGRARISFANVKEELVPLILDEVLNHSLPSTKILGQYLNNVNQPWENIEEVRLLPFFKGQNRVLLENCGVIDPCCIEQYIAYGGYKTFCNTISKLRPIDVCNLIDQSMLLGRGGGGFPVSQKWFSTLNASSDQKYLVCNAIDSDPGSYMNRVIIEGNPHGVLEGVLLAAYAVGASKAYIFIREEFSIAIDRLQKALEYLVEFGLVGHNILDSGVNIDVSIRPAPKALVCGEENALIKSLEGMRAMPEPKPPYPSEKGLWGKPTCVNSVETLLNVPLILRNGADWFRSMGTERSKGTKIFTLSGKVRNTGTVEVNMGTTFRDIVWKIGNGIRANKQFKALLLGINSNNYITEQTLDAKVGFGELKGIGTILGCGGFVVVDQETCMVDLAKYYARFFENESCGKCIPCRDGTTHLLEIMESATRRPATSRSTDTLNRFKGVIQLGRLSEVMKDTSLCGLGKSAPGSILNLLMNFKHEFDAHVYERKCPAGICTDLKVYFIDVEKCTGCTACQKKCPENAIIGSPRQPHFIIEDKCKGCGSCYDACKFNAIYIH